MAATPSVPRVTERRSYPPSGRRLKTTVALPSGVPLRLTL